MRWFQKKEILRSEPTLKEQLAKTKAELARMELLPDSDFTISGRTPPFTMHHGVDRKPREIARQKAKIAYFKILLAEQDEEIKIMWPFRSKKQIEQLKKLPILENHIEVKTNLVLSSLIINYNITQKRPYYAFIEYKEHPKSWADRDNQIKSMELKADSWEELIDKVIGHFNNTTKYAGGK